MNLTRTRRRPGPWGRASAPARALALTLCLALAPALLTGCGQTGPGMAQVTGKVTLDGKPVPKGTITFVSKTPGGRNATGEIGPDGSYRLQTENPGDGALIGEYTVTVFAHDDPVLDYIPPKPIPPKLLAPAKYERAETSGLSAKVEPGSNNLDFPLVDGDPSAPRTAASGK